MTRTLFTVWRFVSPITRDVNVVARHGEPDDLRVQHEFQRILWRGLAVSKGDALSQAEG